MKKLNKKSASLAALQIGTALSPLTVLAQASADTVDDAVAKAESAGLKVRVEDKGDIKVNSKAEADTKNAEADAQLKADAVKVAQAVDSYVAEKTTVQKANQEAQTRYETEVKAEDARVAKAEAEAQKTNTQNTEAQKAYEAEKAKVEAQNAEAQKAYEVEKAKAEAQNAEAQKAYEAEKAKVEAQNAEKLKAYETELANTKAENAKLLAQYEAELQKAKEANQKGNQSNADEVARIQAENAKAQKDYEAELARVTAERDALTKQYEAEKARIEKENAASATTTTADAAKIEADYQAALKAYDQKVKDITAQNQKAQADYEAAKATVEAKNAKIDADYAAAKKAYDEKVAQVTASNKAKQDAYDKALADYKAGKLDTVTNKEKTLTMEVTKAPAGVTVQPARTIEKDLTNSTNLDADLKAAEAEFKAEEAKVNAQLDAFAKTPAEEPVDPAARSLVAKELKAAKDWATAQNQLGQPIGVQYVIKEKVVTGKQATVDAIKSAYDDAIDPTAYKAKVDEFNKGVPAIQAAVDAYNTERKNTLSMVLAGDLNGTLGSKDLGTRIINDNNMKFTKSSDRVQYLRSQNFSTLDDAMRQGFDIANSANTASATPVENQLAKVKFTAVRIPKGESVTVEYTRKDGKDYIPADGLLGRSTMFVTDSDYAKKDTFTRDDSQALSKIRYTVRNDGSMSSDGDLIMFFMNDTAVPAYYGISNMGSTEGANRFQLMSDPRQMLGTTSTTEFFNSNNDVLRATLNELSVVYPDKNDPSTFKLLFSRNFVKGNLPSVDSAPVKEYISQADASAGVADHGTVFGNSLKPVEEVPNLPSNWKDTKSWNSYQTGWDGAKLVSHQKDYNKVHATEATMTGNRHYQVSEVHTGYFNVETFRALRTPTTPTFPYVSSEATYISARPTGELVRTIEVPVVRGADASSTPREVTPVKMVIKYKEVKKGTEPTKPTLEQVPTTPPAVNKDPLPKAPLPAPLPEKPVKGQVKPGTQKPLPEQPKLPELPKKPTPKPLPDAGTVVVEPKKPTLKSEPVKPPLTPTPEKPSLVTPPEAPKLKDVPKPPTSTPSTKVERKVIEKPKLQEEPKAPELTLSKVHYVYQPKTIWETVDGKVLRKWEDGEKPKDGFDGYEYVRTDKDKDGNIRHIYKPVEKPQEQPKVKTIWETVDGKVLRNWENGEKPKDGFDGYEYVRTDKDKDGNIHHIYKPAKKVTTIWVTVDGKVLRERKDGTLPKDSFDGYEYVRTDVDKEGNTTHIFKPVEKPVKKVTTIWVTVDGKVLRERTDGTLPKDSFDGYEYVRTDVDKDGNTTHVFKPVEKPVKKVTTIWVTVDGKVLRERKEGTLPKDSFDGYEYVETRVDEDGNTTHIFKPVVKSIKTIWETVDHAKTLRQWQDGEQPKDSFDGYEYVTTEHDEDGNIHHLYKPVVKELPKEPSKPEVKPAVQPQTAKELPKTGDAGMLTSMFGGLFAGTGFFGMKRKKNRKK